MLDAIVDKIPPPQGDADAPTKALIFDSVFDPYRGTLVYFRVVDGTLAPGDKIRLMATGYEAPIDDLAVHAPEETPIAQLGPGEVGLLTAAIKEVGQAKVGDTITNAGRGAAPEPLPGYREPLPMVFSGLYPVDSDDFPELRDALDKLQLNDASFTFEPETSAALGFGFRCGFLGLLHLDIITERIDREFNIPLVATAPSVRYRVRLEDESRADDEPEWVEVSNPQDLPPPNKIDHITEPTVEAMILTPAEYVGKVMQLCEGRRGDMQAMDYLTEDRVELRYILPLGEIITDFFDQLKSMTRGFASLDYRMGDYRRADLVKVDVLLNGDPVDAFSSIRHRDDAYEFGKPHDRAAQGADPQADVRRADPGRDRLARDRPRDRQGQAQGRARQVLRRRRLAQAQAAGEAEGGQEEDEEHRDGRDPARGLRLRPARPGPGRPGLTRTGRTYRATCTWQDRRGVRGDEHREAARQGRHCHHGRRTSLPCKETHDEHRRTDR